jgi:hypothetical protein
MKERGETAERVTYDEEIGRVVREIQQLKDARKKLEAEMDEIRNEQ